MARSALGVVDDVGGQRGAMRVLCNAQAGAIVAEEGLRGRLQNVGGQQGCASTEVGDVVAGGHLGLGWLVQLLQGRWKQSRSHLDTLRRKLWQGGDAERRGRFGSMLNVRWAVVCIIQSSQIGKREYHCHRCRRAPDYFC